MQNAYIVTGTLTDEKTIELDEALLIQATKVRLIIEPLPNPIRRPFAEVMAEIHQRQEARGHIPPTAEEVNAYLKAERDSWDE